MAVGRARRLSPRCCAIAASCQWLSSRPYATVEARLDGLAGTVTAAAHRHPVPVALPPCPWRFQIRPPPSSQAAACTPAGGRGASARLAAQNGLAAGSRLPAGHSQALELRAEPHGAATAPRSGPWSGRCLSRPCCIRATPLAFGPHPPRLGGAARLVLRAEPQLHARGASEATAVPLEDARRHRHGPPDRLRGLGVAPKPLRSIHMARRLCAMPLAYRFSTGSAGGSFRLAPLPARRRWPAASAHARTRFSALP